MTDTKAAFDSVAETLPAKGEGQIILCDCNGTLFDANHMKGFNRPLFDFLMGAKERGYDVYLHSGDAQGNMDTFVPIFSIKNKDFASFIAAEDQRNEICAILPKGEIASSKAILTIDDQHGGEFPSQAKHQWSPNDPRITATMAAWGLMPVTSAPSVVPAAQASQPTSLKS